MTAREKLTNIRASCSQCKQALVGMAAVLKRAEENRARFAKDRDRLTKATEKLDNVMRLLRSLSGGAREFVCQTVNPLANEAVKELFGADAVFEISFRELPKQGWVAEIASGTETRLGNPLDTDGLSMAEVISDAVLRPLVVSIHNPALNRVVLLDEPFAGVDKERPGPLCAFLRTLCDKLGMQIILTSHTFDDEYDAYFDNVITLGDG